MSLYHVKGDATYPQGEGQKLIIHVTNDAGGWGSGFVLALNKRWMEPKKAYAKAFMDESLMLGAMQYAKVEEDITVANMCAQRGYHQVKTGEIPLCYFSLLYCLGVIRDRVKETKEIIHAPKFGSGLAGGDWNKIEPMLEDIVKLTDVFIYTLE